MKLEYLQTPALIVDEKVFSDNMRHMSELLKGKMLKLRPHYKSHKCAAIAHRQILSGAIGMTCAKLSEAEDLCDSGVDDILIANQIVEPEKLIRLALLAKKCRLTVCIDDIENAKAVSEAAQAVGSTVYCLVEYDIGMRRCGLRTTEDYVRVAKAVCALPGIVYDGIQAYAGYASHVASCEERLEMTKENEKKVCALRELLKAEGIEVKTISGGSTGTSVIKAEDGIYTELQAGSYLFMDSTYDHLDIPFKSSLYVLSSVVSVNADAVILDAGVKSLGADQEDPVILTEDGRRITGRIELNEEHLKLYDASEKPKLGEKLYLIPGHCCSTVNLYDRLYFFRDGNVTERLEITARGKSK